MTCVQVPVPGGVTDMVSIRDELMLATRDGHILRYCWDGQVCLPVSCILYPAPCTVSYTLMFVRSIETIAWT